MDLAKLRSTYAAKVAEAETIMAEAKDDQLPKDRLEKVNSLLAESDSLKAQIVAAEQIEAGNKFMSEGTGSKAAHLGWRPSAPGEGEPGVDPSSWREISIPSPWGEKKVRFFVPEVVQTKGYNHAFEAYVRRGYSELGAEDRKTITEGVDSSGGFLTPEDFHVELIRKIATNAIIRSMARVVGTSRDIASWPRVVYTADDKYTSGVRLTWTGEVPSSATVHRVTEPVIGEFKIPVHTAMASMPFGNDTIEDSAFDLLGIGSSLFGEAFALGEDDVFINGDGVSKPMGILTEVNGNGMAYVISGTSASIVTAADANPAQRILDVYYAVPAQYRRNAAWVANSGTAKAMESIVDGQKRPILTSLIGGSLADAAEPDRVKNKPLRIDEFTPDIAANSYPLIFGDWSGYLILDRVGLSIQRLSEIYAETNITLLLAKKRVGGYLVEPYRFRCMKAGTS